MENKHFTALEKLEQMKQIEAHNEERRKAFAEKKRRDARLFELYELGHITREELERKLKENH